MSVLRAVYLALAVWGGVRGAMVLWSGGAWQPLVLAGTLPAAQLALAVWCLAEVYVRKNWVALAALPATWALGIGCGLPLYLFLRTAPPS